MLGYSKGLNNYNMRKYIYARTSTNMQDTENQTTLLLQQFPDAEVIQEIASGGKARPKLLELISRLEKGDTLVVAALDRLGRKTVEILTLIEDLDRRGIILKSLREGIDYGSISGRLVVQILVSVSELERSLISQRTKAALEAKRLQGIIGGRKPKFTKKQITEALTLRAAGATLKETAEKTGMSLSRVHQLTRRSANAKS